MPRNEKLNDTVKQPRILIVPDSFKGSLSAAEVVQIMTAVFHKEIKGCEVVGIPVADGGEGTVDAILSALGGVRHFCQIEDPLGKTVEAFYGRVDDLAIIEMAQASGITRLSENEKNPMVTSTYGTGQLLLQAIESGAKSVILGIGGSATNDGGTGFASALGIEFYDNQGVLISDRGAQILGRIDKIDCSNMDERLASVEMTVICDVTSPLTGSTGATYVFGPQKGLHMDQLAAVDADMVHYRSVLQNLKSMDVGAIAGSGAAGGLGAALIAFLGATLKPGIDVILDLTEFDEQVKNADLVITGEGKIDHQTSFGKVPVGVAQKCKRIWEENSHQDASALNKKPSVIAICGMVGEGAEMVYDYGIDDIISLVSADVSVEEAMNHARYHLENATKVLAQRLKPLPMVWVDADGCPVVEAVINIAQKNAIPVTIVKNYAIHIESEYAKIITVDISRDSADYYIANHLKPEDLVITQDNGLAAMVLAKRGFCMNQNGKEITAFNIDFMLDSRHQSRMARMQSGKGPKHKKRTEADNQSFQQALVTFINEKYK